MAITENLRDLSLGNNIQRQVTLDLVKVIPVDNEGDEVYATTATTTATSKIGTGGTISPSFLRQFKAGFAKSSGFKTPPFTVTSGSNDKLQVSIDGSTFREITLSPGIGLSGEDIADDLQTKLNALALTGGAEQGKQGFLNVLVEFKDNRFHIISGTVSDTYTGVGKSSVLVNSGTNDVSATLGFDIPVESEVLATKRPTETKLATGYVSGTTLDVESVSDFQAGQAFTITDGANREYFIAAAIGSGDITISGSGLVNDYVAGSVVQKIFERDPSSDLASPYEDVDALIRFQLRMLANQISFS